MVIAARKLTAGSLSAFVISDNVHFENGFVSEEPVDVDAINQQGYEILCRNRHYQVCGEEYDAVIFTNGKITWGYYVVRLATTKRTSIFSKILRLLRNPKLVSF